VEVVDHFIREVNVNESKINNEQKKVNRKHQVTSDTFSSLLASVGSAEVMYILKKKKKKLFMTY